MRLTKHHGLGNDFLVALESDNPGLAEPSPELARVLCDRRRGVGADGLVYGYLGEEGVDLRMVLLNADGSRAEVSGNGIRCLAQAECRQRGTRRADLAIAVDHGLRRVHVEPGPAILTLRASVDMGSTHDGPDLGALPPELGGARHATVDIGNPHAVFLVDDPFAVDLAAIGPVVERSVEGGVNVEFIAATSTDEIALAVWERGAGITEACGSGACAAAVAAHRWGLVGKKVTVRMPGGEAEVELGETVVLTGPATFVATVEV